MSLQKFQCTHYSSLNASKVRTTSITWTAFIMKATCWIFTILTSTICYHSIDSLPVSSAALCFTGVPGLELVELWMLPVREYNPLRVLLREELELPLPIEPLQSLVTTWSSLASLTLYISVISLIELGVTISSVTQVSVLRINETTNE